MCDRDRVAHPLCIQDLKDSFRFQCPAVFVFTTTSENKGRGRGWGPDFGGRKFAKSVRFPMEIIRISSWIGEKNQRDPVTASMQKKKKKLVSVIYNLGKHAAKTIKNLSYWIMKKAIFRLSDGEKTPYYYRYTVPGIRRALNEFRAKQPNV